MLNLTREPVALISAAIGLIQAAIALAIAFGVNLTDTQVGAIMAFVIAVGTVAQVLLVRPLVTPVADPRDNNGNALAPVANTGR
jgi:hypothetical protein